MPSTPKNEFNPPDISFTINNLNVSHATVRIGVESSFYHKVDNQLKKYKRLPELFRPALEQVGDYVRIQMIPRTFKEEGPGWAQLSHRARRERQFQGVGEQHPILVRSGDLFRSLTEKAHPKHIEILKVGKMARIEIGSDSQKFVENQQGVSYKRLPARPMIPGTGGMPLPDRDRIAIQGIIRRAIKDRIR